MRRAACDASQHIDPTEYVLPDFIGRDHSMISVTVSAGKRIIVSSAGDHHVWRRVRLLGGHDRYMVALGIWPIAADVTPTMSTLATAN